MNEIEEYLLIIFLETRFSRYDQIFYEFTKKSDSYANQVWEQFKQEELGRTLPEEYEYYASDFALECMRYKQILDIYATTKPIDKWNKKIKITVVEG